MAILKSVQLPEWLDDIIYNEFGAVYEPRPQDVEYNPDQQFEFVQLYLGNVVAYLKNNMGEETWKNSREKEYINELYAFLYDPSRSFNLSFYNKELEAISAFLVRGNSYSDIISYLKINEIEDYTLPLVLWGALSGYMDMNRDYIEGILSESVCNKVYRMLFGVDCSVLSAEIDTKILSVDSITVEDETSPKETFDDSGYMFLLQILKFKSPEDFIERILAFSTKKQLSIKQSLDSILSTKEYKKAKVQSSNAKGAYELIENRGSRDFLEKKMQDLKLSKKAQVQVLEYFGYKVTREKARNKKIKLEGSSQDLFSRQNEQELKSNTIQKINFTSQNIDLIARFIHKINPNLSDFANRQIRNDLEWVFEPQYSEGKSEAELLDAFRSVLISGKTEPKSRNGKNMAWKNKAYGPLDIERTIQALKEQIQ